MKKYITTALKGFTTCLLAGLIPTCMITGIVALFSIHTLPVWGAIGTFVLIVGLEVVLAILAWAIGAYLEEDYYDDL